jgi:hypothetical protein
MSTRAADMNARQTDTPKKRLEYVFGETAKGNMVAVQGLGENITPR